MLKNRLTDITFITGMFIIIFYTGGAIYLIGFWSTFDLDVSGFVSLSDVPKNFVFPFCIYGVFFIFLGIIIELVRKERNKFILKKKKVSVMDPKKSVKRLNEIINKYIDLAIVAYILIVYYFFNNFSSSYLYWVISLLLFGIISFSKVSKVKFIKKRIPNPITRNYFLSILIAFVILCFGFGKVSSLHVYKNENVNSVKIIEDAKSQFIINSESLKLLGFVGNKAIISSLDNKRIFILNEESYKGFEIENLRNNIER